MSNEHPDMSGNPMDAPFFCDHCGKQVQEDKAFGVPRNDDVLFCSNECANEWVDDQIATFHESPNDLVLTMKGQSP